jgi:peptidoglycan glycosyltransferase
MVNYVQFVRADELNSDPRNTLAVQREFDQARGQVLSADGVVLARSVPSAPGDQFAFQREYPTGDLFAHVTGFLNFNFGAEGVERTYGDELTGGDLNLRLDHLSDLFVERERTEDITLTLRNDVQQVAREALGDNRGSVVAIDPRDGSLLALWSNPTYDPNPLSSHDQAAASAARAALEPDSRQSGLIPAFYRKSFFPGSTFKVVTGSIGVNDGVVTPDQPSYPVATEFDIDFTDNELSNFGGERCGGPLFDILRASCNSAFAQMGVETIGQDRMVSGAQAFGVDQRVPIDLPAPALSRFPVDFPADQGNGPLARASIGQGDVTATPLQMALVAAGVANGGVIMTPHVLDRVTDETGDVIKSFEPTPWLQAISPDAAAVMRQAMLGVVQSGTGTRAQISGFEVGGKTGTAQLGTDPPSSHAWFIAFAGPPGQPPTVAVAVIVEAQPGVSEVTGGRVAAPVAQAVMQAVLNVQAAGG